MEAREGTSRRVRAVASARVRLRAGWDRVRSGWLQIIQTALAACVAWFLAVLILGIDRPTFAPIAAVIALGLAVGERVRRAVELTLAVAFGVAMADLLVSLVGVGAVQAGAVVLLAMGLAVFLGGGDLGVKEAAISALIIMITFRSSQAGFPIERFLEALIGGGTALLINALLPVNPERMVEDAAYPVFAESAAVLEEVADALEDGDARRAQRAYVKAREIDARVAGLKEAVAAGRETARLAPPRPAPAEQSRAHGTLHQGGRPDRPDGARREGSGPSRALRGPTRSRRSSPPTPPSCDPRPGPGDGGSGRLP
ncbi:MAG TPA: FUSC family protein, partial [Rubrobacter sp.]|nr:FUSC family protein [Rubrobacter sp.]